MAWENLYFENAVLKQQDWNYWDQICEDQHVYLLPPHHHLCYCQVPCQFTWVIMFLHCLSWPDECINLCSSVSICHGERQSGIFFCCFPVSALSWILDGCYNMLRLFSSHKVVNKSWLPPSHVCDSLSLCLFLS